MRWSRHSSPKSRRSSLWNVIRRNVGLMRSVRATRAANGRYAGRSTAGFSSTSSSTGAAPAARVAVEVSTA